MLLLLCVVTFLSFGVGLKVVCCRVCFMFVAFWGGFSRYLFGFFSCLGSIGICGVCLLCDYVVVVVDVWRGGC